MTAEHGLQPCVLPRPRRRWLGLVARCRVCGREYSLALHVGDEKSWPEWEAVSP